MCIRLVSLPKHDTLYEQILTCQKVVIFNNFKVLKCFSQRAHLLHILLTVRSMRIPLSGVYVKYLVTFFVNLFIIVNLFFCSYSFAQQSNDNVAVVTWTGFNNRESFEHSPDHMNKLFCSSDGAFCVKQDNYITIDMEACFPEDFADKFKEAVGKITNKKNPILIFALVSHGEEGLLHHQAQDDIKYEDLLDTLFENTIELNKEITLMLFVSACYSGSIIPVIQEKLHCNDTEEDCNLGTDGVCYRHKISVYTSAPSDKASWGSEFLEVLNLVNNLEDCKDKENCGLNYNGILTFLSLDNMNDHTFWSSFYGKNEKLPSSADDKDVVVKLLNSNNSELSLHAAVTLYKTASKGDKKAIATFIDALKNCKDPNVRMFAAGMLGEIAQGDEDAIEALNCALKSDKDKYVRLTVVSAFGKAALQGNEKAIKALHYTVENDTDIYVIFAAVEELDKVDAKGDGKSKPGTNN